jgi:hypothetical protein
MSVTFTLEANPTGSFTAECYDGPKVFHADSYDGILLAITAHKMICADCDMAGMCASAVMDVSDGFDVDLCNANALMILSILGLDTDDELAGSATAEQFLGHVLLALAEDRDGAAVPAVEMPRATNDEGRPVGAQLIYGGLSEGYVASTLGRLHHLAAEAQRLGRDITWA